MITTITSHAAERYRTRHARHLSLEEARTALAELAEGAVRLREKSVHGQDVWQADDILLVTKYDSGARVVVTVLPPDSFHSRSTIIADAELLAESEADLAEMRALIKSEQEGPKTKRSPLFHVTVLTKKNVKVLAHEIAISTCLPQPSAEEKTKRMQIVAETYRLNEIEATKRAVEKTKRTLDHNQVDNKRLTEALRVAVRLLMSGEGDLKDVGESFLAPRFWKKKP